MPQPWDTTRATSQPTPATATKKGTAQAPGRCGPRSRPPVSSQPLPGPSAASQGDGACAGFFLPDVILSLLNLVSEQRCAGVMKCQSGIRCTLALVRVPMEAAGTLMYCNKLELHKSHHHHLHHHPPPRRLQEQGPYGGGSSRAGFRGVCKRGTACTRGGDGELSAGAACASIRSPLD